MEANPAVLVTAGDTFEAIDDVRRITHMATGRLGSLLADEFTARGARVTYLCGQNALRPAAPVEETVPISGVLELQSEMRRLLAQRPYACVAHSMAVSDYTVTGLAAAGDVAAAVTAALNAAPGALTQKEQTALVAAAIEKAHQTPAGKISSDYGQLSVLMKRAPKVISMVKKMQPQTVLVGFKLLSGVSRQQLLCAAAAQIEHSGSDFVLANDLASIQGDEHQGLLVGPGGRVLARCATKQQVAATVAAFALEKAHG